MEHNNWGLNRRYDRILEVLYRLAVEGKTEGEREAARNRIAAIEEKIRAENIKPGLELDYEALERQAREAEERDREERRRQAELRIKEELKRREELKKKEYKQWERRAQQKQKQAIIKDKNFAMRANWVYSMIKDEIEDVSNNITI